MKEARNFYVLAIGQGVRGHWPECLPFFVGFILYQRLLSLISKEAY
jgi:hypothetical protein